MTIKTHFLSSKHFKVLHNEQNVSTLKMTILIKILSTYIK